MTVKLTRQELSEKYDRIARWYDVVEGVPDLLGLLRLRRRLLQSASGKVLEVAIGTGKNLACYPHGCKITAVDVSRNMLARARMRAEKLALNIDFALIDAEVLGFPGETFDTVVSSLTTCTFPNPVAALGEIARVCKKDGRILLLEHGRSDRQWLGRWQDRRTEKHARQFGCHWNRQPLEIAKQAGLRIVSARSHFLGVFQEIEAAP